MLLILSLIHIVLKDVVSGIDDGDGGLITLHLFSLVSTHLLKHISLISTLSFDDLDKLDEQRFFEKKSIESLVLPFKCIVCTVHHLNVLAISGILADIPTGHRNSFT